MPANVDQVADATRGGIEIRRLAKIYTFPDFVKSAGVQNLMPDSSLSTTNAYADPVRKQFRCNTAAATWLSSLFYQEKRAEFHPKDRVFIEKNLEKMISYWRIKEAVDVMRAKWQELHKTSEDELPDHMFGYVWVGDNGHKDRHLPLRTRMEVKAAAEWLDTYKDRIPFQDRNIIAKKILEKAASYGASVGDLKEFIERQAGMGVPAGTNEIIDAIEKRSALSKNPELKESFKKMAFTVKSMPRKALMPDTLVKLACTLDMLDRQMGLAGKYGEEFKRPEDVIFKATFCKIAEDNQKHVALTSGKVFSKEQLSKLAADDLCALFGKEFVDRVRTGLDIDVEKLAEEVQTLPRPDAAMLEGLLSDNGIAPVLTKSASARQGFMKEELEAWSKAYASV